MFFLAWDCIILYYSINYFDFSIGGLDIVKVVFNVNFEIWIMFENLLMKINFFEDDVYFWIVKDGFMGFFVFF